ncbi:hypothetical protein L0128_08745 [candidate division KSB1 bacterium]|nr:hypothetical protein [candidate division KSB1 bacterium]
MIATNSEPQSTSSARVLRRILRRLAHPNCLLGMVLIIIFLILEGNFDVLEIGLGKMIAWTNSLRPRSGPVWHREIQAEIATREVQSIEEIPPVAEPEILPVENLSELLAILEQKEEVRITRKNFLSIYTNLPYLVAQRIISPYDLLILQENPNWQLTLLARIGQDLRVYFVDAENQILHDSYFSFMDYEHELKTVDQSESELEEIEEFQGRIVTRVDFFRAYNPLPMNIKIFIMNDPMQLIRWGDALKYIAISRYIVAGAVTVAFQIQMGPSRTIVRYQASEIAVTRLIEQLNQVLTDKFLAMPERN